MITLRTIKATIIAVLKTKYPDYKVHFDNVEKSDAPYFYVEMRPTANTWDRIISERIIQIDIQFIPLLDKYGRADRNILYDMADSMEVMFRPVFRIEDRYITVLEAETTFFDEILHYIFNLDFADAFTSEEIGGIQYELMQQLGLELNGQELNEEEL
ncbi:hypothetical protein AB840_04145 [Megasphaera cerevisiae DSM 20462]|uniref:Phage protein n=1 Tax=Megasphaera cerevisiae DSM 20462 TaxID=1122219 RepID=A0A0J6ZQJ1_9FIRM|nr:hypothetical protein [Megasphaera cerevisiae]KMO87226.1 hypothetical protein AB840_04145 [Megasphaera cerevisiae DSM 20462]SJZ61165.1 hypothetical protein SAMN05660900_00961 [Megasphaera cerevisiae DSM 20462]